MREQVPHSKKNNSHSSNSVQNSFIRRTAITQLKQGYNAVPTQEEIENQQYQQDQFEATKLQIQAKYGTITPEGQERLAFLQAKKAEFWQRYLAPVRHINYDFANIPITREQAEAKSKKAIQAKLTIGAPGDKYEQEADRVAAQVVNHINSPTTQQSNQNLQREEMSEEDELMKKPEINGIQREAMPEVGELQMKQTGDGSMAASAELESSIQQARGGGQPLADNVRKPMEHAFGADFSGVKVHTDARADQLNQSIQAKAFTTGQDVFFRQGAYEPGSRGGQELIAHELTHVVQQSRAATNRGRLDHTKETTKAGALLQRMNSGTTSAQGARPVAANALRIILNKIREHANNLNDMYGKPGGWELWLQGELYLALTSNNIPALAETSAYGTQQAADFTFAANTDMDLVCELKCEGLHSQNRFSEAVKQDRLKLQKLKKGVAIQIAVARNITPTIRFEQKIIIDAPAGKSLGAGKFTVYVQTFAVGA